MLYSVDNGRLNKRCTIAISVMPRGEHLPLECPMSTGHFDGGVRVSVQQRLRRRRFPVHPSRLIEQLFAERAFTVRPGRHLRGSRNVCLR